MTGMRSPRSLSDLGGIGCESGKLAHVSRKFSLNSCHESTEKIITNHCVLLSFIFWGDETLNMTVHYGRIFLLGEGKPGI